MTMSSVNLRSYVVRACMATTAYLPIFKALGELMKLCGLKDNNECLFIFVVEYLCTKSWGLVEGASTFLTLLSNATTDLSQLEGHFI